MTNAQIIAEFDRLEREILASLEKSRKATQEAIETIDKIMADLAPPSKERTDA